MNNIFKKLKLKRRAITALMAMHFYGNPSAKLKVIGVTGTNGKTTTTTLLYRVATALGYKVGLIGTVENIIDGEVSPATHTTPDPLLLNKLLSKMADRGCQYVFMEVSSHALDQRRVAGINFAGAVFTNLTHDHLDYHKSLENYFNAKKRLFKGLKEEAFALTNTDDEHGREIVDSIKARKFSYGFKNEEDFHADITKLDFTGIDLRLFRGKIESKLLGKFNAYNLLAVWSTCELLGFNMNEVKKILEDITPPQGRFDHFMSSQGVLGVVDFAHTPDALENVISTARGIVSGGGRVISVFGCSGDKDPFKRPIMGKIGARLSDISIFTSDNPRSENPEKIMEQMKPDLSPDELGKIKIIINRDEAIAEASKIAKKNDIVLLMGKGHEPYQDIKGIKYPWNEMEKLKKALN